ncbi:hypothetical protein KKG22_00800 [Patescibacteria group bacterium]|nr:hypothetical protein [Patescibacteria group bacterium]MBU1721974.1 hypothetical protein [Patescibacteria group bacterium]MBU1901278.1 hypothetical protein [Patescibacteria group bacterium]
MFNKQSEWEILIISGLIIIVASFFLDLNMRHPKRLPQIEPTITVSTPTTVKETTQQDEEEEDIVEEINKLEQIYLRDNLEIDWHYGSIPLEDSSSFISKIDPNYHKTLNDLDYYPKFTEEDSPDILRVVLFEAGIIEAPESISGPFYHLFILDEAMYHQYDHYLVSYHEGNKQFLVLSRIGPDHFARHPSIKKLDWFYAELTSPDIRSDLFNNDLPALTFDNNYFIFSHDNQIHSLSGQNLGGIIDIDQQIVEVPDQDSVIFKHNTYGPVRKNDQGYYIIFEDGSTHYFELIPNFFKDIEYPNNLFNQKIFHRLSRKAPKVDIILNNGKALEDFYYIGQKFRRICFHGSFISTSKYNIVTTEDWFDENKLVSIGETGQGDPIYELSDKETNEYYDKFFNFSHGFYQYSGIEEDGDIFDKFRQYKEKPLQERKSEFLNGPPPMFFWKDSFGDWRVYLNFQYAPPEGCY